MNERRRQGTRPGEPLRLDDIVAAAMRIIEERGASRFSIRALAAELEVFPTAIYWHVESRARLLALVNAAWMHDVVPPADGLEWSEWLYQLGRSYRAAVKRSPNVARLIASELITDPAGFDLPEAIVGHLVAGGVPADEIVHAYNTIVGATVGFVDLEFARDPVRTDDERRRIEAEIHALDPERYPALAAHVDTMADRAFSMRWTEATEAPLDESYEYFMTLLIEGLRRRIDR